MGHSGELCGVEITGPKIFSETVAAAKIITGTKLEMSRKFEFADVAESLGQTETRGRCKSRESTVTVTL